MRKKFLLLTGALMLLFSGCGGKEDSITCKITCKLDDEYSLGIDEDENLVITEDGDEEIITFELHPVDEEYYYIEHVESGLVLGTEDESDEVHAKVTLVEYEEDDTQLWQISETDDDFYYIINKESELFLDINDAKIFDGNILQLYTRNDSFKAQSWKFIDIEDDDIEYEPVTVELEDDDSDSSGSSAQSSDSNEPLEVNVDVLSMENEIELDESYRIACKFDASFCIGAEIGDIPKVILTNSEDSTSFAYYLSEVEENVYCIVHEDSGLVIELQDGAIANNTHVCLGEYNGSQSQQWYVAKAPTEGYYFFISVASGRYLDVTHLGVFDGNWLQIYQPGISDAQSWMFTEY